MAAESFGAFFPRIERWRIVCGRPVALGELRRHVFRIAREFEDVPERNAHVFEQLPRSVRRALWFRSLKLGRKIVERFLPGQVGVAAVEKLAELFADNFFAA